MKHTLFILFLLLIPSELFTQTFNEYYNQRQKEYDKYLNQTEEEYKKFHY